jgi:hypothetical protein
MLKYAVVLMSVVCGEFIGLGTGGRMHTYADLMGGRDAGR